MEDRAGAGHRLGWGDCRTAHATLHMTARGGVRQGNTYQTGGEFNTNHLLHGRTIRTMPRHAPLASGPQRDRLGVERGAVMDAAQRVMKDPRYPRAAFPPPSETIQKAEVLLKMSREVVAQARAFLQTTRARRKEQAEALADNRARRE